MLYVISYFHFSDIFSSFKYFVLPSFDYFLSEIIFYNKYSLMAYSIGVYLILSHWKMTHVATESENSIRPSCAFHH